MKLPCEWDRKQQELASTAHEPLARIQCRVRSGSNPHASATVTSKSFGHIQMVLIGLQDVD